ncbi:DsbA family protein [Martelella mediterranea]|uniref:Protein-disulfide isomerase n=1 Tax=Martelella mediterranea TaxID=293089 RepID=A0A4R3P224_9HYPH|nr:DsbA family protein [Martelella mediterranea]TCT44598.1 protein-disulfide isomerase [Martelella mediterranea]
MPNRRTLLKGMAASAGFTLLPFGTNVSAVAHEPSPEMVFDDPAAPVLGNPDGDVTVVEYFDVQCGYCKRDYPMMRDVVARDGGVKLVMKDWPIFGPVSVFAAQAMQAAAELGEYETALDALMRSQGRLSHEQIEGILTGAGLDMGSLTTAVVRNEKKISDLLDRNYHQAEAFQFVGTPSFVIGKTIYPGVLNKSLLEEAIAKARRET